MSTKLPVILLVSTFLFASFFLFGAKVKSANTDIVINEIGAYEPSDHEWLEIYNKGTTAVDLTGWKFWEAGINHGLNLAQGEDYLLEPGEYAIITQNDFNFKTDYPNFTGTIFDSSWSNLNESGEEIGLKNSTGESVELFTYLTAETNSLERKDANTVNYTETNWLEHPSGNSVGNRNYWSGEADPGEEPTNQPPQAIITPSTTTIYTGAEIIFDATDSFDSDGIVVGYLWKIDNITVGTESTLNYTFVVAGTKNVSLTVTDDEGASGDTLVDLLILDLPSDEPDPTEPTLTQIKINELVSDAPENANEWIELYNLSTENIDLTGYTLHDGNGLIASPTSTILANGFVLINLSSNKLNNSGDIVILKNQAGEIVDQVAYGAWDDGDTSDNAPATSDPNSLARKTDGQDSNTDNLDFADTSTPTPLAPNTITSLTENNNPPSTGGGSQTPTPAISFHPGDLLINELVSDPADNSEEFVELYNPTNQTISLAGWKLEDGSETPTILAGTIDNKSFYVIEKPKGNLNNQGDSIALFDPAGNKIDQVVYGDWDDGNLNDNAPAPNDPYSLIRYPDGRDSNYDYYDLVITATITPGKKNILTMPEGLSNTDLSSGQQTKIVINEILPNPIGDDNETEFIELYNVGEETINLIGLKLADATNKQYEIKQGSLKPKEYLAVFRSQSKIALNNSGSEEIILMNASGGVIDKIKYTGSVTEDTAYARTDDNGWDWTTTPTPGKTNLITGTSVAPIIQIYAPKEATPGETVWFDASDTTHPEGDNLTLLWRFDDNSTSSGRLVSHIFSSVGTHEVMLTVSDSLGNKTEKKVLITITTNPNVLNNTEELSSLIEITEIFPNPSGADNDEFVELFNPGIEAVNLSGLKLDDGEGGSRPYTLPDQTIIKPGEYLTFDKDTTHLALNNTGDTVRLLDENGQILQQVEYDETIEGASYARDTEKNWHWTSHPTPGAQNEINAPQAVAGIKISQKSPKTFQNIPLAQIKDADLGDRVRVTGVVSVTPGVLGSQYFYIVDSPMSTSSHPTGLQIYSYKKDFPELAIGDKVEVVGEISQSGGNLRLKTSQASDIKNLEHSGEPEPISIDIAEIDEPLEAVLIKISGEITELKSSYMYLDDGTDEVKIYFKQSTGINSHDYSLGDLVQVVGIVQQTGDGYQVLPRFSPDIEKTGVAEGPTKHIESAKAENQKEVAEKYLTATAGGLTAILIGLVLQAKSSTIAYWFKKFLNKKSLDE